MSGQLPQLSSSILKRSIAVSVLPIIVVGLVCWGLLVRASWQTTKAEHERMVAGLAAKFDQRLQEIDAVVLHTALTVNSVSSELQPAMLKASLESDTGLHALLILSGDGIVREVEMRRDLSGIRGNLAGIDLSRLGGAAHRGKPSNFAHGPKSPVDGMTMLTCSRELATGETLLAMVDTAAIAEHLHKEIPGPGLFAISASDCSAVLYADSGALDILAGLERSSGNTSKLSTSESHVLAFAPVAPGGLRIGLAVAAPPPAGITGYPLIVLGTTLAACLVTALLSLVSGRHFSRPIAILDAELKGAIARPEGAGVRSQPYVETESIAHTARQLMIGSRDTQDRLATIQRAIHTAAVPLLRAPGANAIVELGNALASVTNARCILIAEWVPGFKPRASVLGASTNIPLPPDYSYELSGNPSQQVASSPIVHIRSRVMREYPESTLLRLLGAEGYVCVPLMMGDGSVGGHLEMIDDHDILLTDSLRDLLMLFSARAAGEVERIRAQRKLRELEDAYLTATLDQHDPICRWTADTTMTFANDAFCLTTGKPREALLGRSLLTSLQEDDRQTLLRQIRDLNTASPSNETELRIIGRDGPRWQRWTSRALLDDKGRITEYQATARDITDIRGLSADLVEAQLRFSVLAANCPVAFWLTDWKTQRCIYVSPMFESIWGISPSAVRDTTMAWTSVVHEADRTQVVRQYLLHAAEGQYQETHRIVRPSGVTAIIRSRAIPIRDRDGHVHRIANIAYEVQSESAQVIPAPQSERLS